MSDPDKRLALNQGAGEQSERQKAIDANQVLFDLVCDFLSKKERKKLEDDRAYGLAMGEALQFLKKRPKFSSKTDSEIDQSPDGRAINYDFRRIFEVRNLGTTLADDLHRDGKEGGVVFLRPGLQILIDGVPPMRSINAFLDGLESYLRSKAAMVKDQRYRELTDAEVAQVFHYYLLEEQRFRSGEWQDQVVGPSFRSMLRLNGIDPKSLPDVSIDYTLTDASPQGMVNHEDGSVSWLSLDQVGAQSHKGIISNALTTEQKRDIVTNYFRLCGKGLAHLVREGGFQMQEGFRLQEEMRDQLQSVQQVLDGLQAYLQQTDQTGDSHGPESQRVQRLAEVAGKLNEMLMNDMRQSSTPTDKIVDSTAIVE